MALSLLTITLPNWRQNLVGPGMEAASLFAFRDIPATTRADSLEAVFRAAGTWEKEAETIAELREGDRLLKHKTLEGLGEAWAKILDDLKEFPESYEGENRENLVYRIEYDPIQWEEGDSRFVDFPSGRIFWLIQAGVLNLAGFEVEIDRL
jgi:hypothetical protein